MKSAAHVAALLAGALVAAPIGAVTRDANVYTLTPAELLRCDAEGGCVVVTVKQLQDAVQQAIDQAIDDECYANTKVRARAPRR